MNNEPMHLDEGERKDFFFEFMWVKEERFKMVVKETWNATNQEATIDVLMGKLRHCSEVFTGWNFWAGLENEGKKRKRFKETMWQQQSRVNWLYAADRNIHV